MMMFLIGKRPLLRVVDGSMSTDSTPPLPVNCALFVCDLEYTPS